MIKKWVWLLLYTKGLIVRKFFEFVTELNRVIRFKKLAPSLYKKSRKLENVSYM